MRLFLAICLIAVLAPAIAASEPDWNTRVAPFDQVFPALELSQARRNNIPASTDHVLGNGSGLIAVRVRARRANERVILSIAVPELGPAQRFGATLTQADTDYELHPPLAWSVEKLRTLTTARATQMEFALERDGNPELQREPISLRPLNEALYFVRDGKDSVDLSWIFAAYVNEHDPVVDEILQEARDTGIVDSFASADINSIYRQVWAVWQVLLTHGIQYSSADPAIERGPRVFSQRVRFLRETWADASANCVDGSVLIASVLQRIGLRTFLVLVPGHAFVGFYADPETQRAAYLETTLLGAHVPALTKLPEFAGNRADRPERKASLASFVAAMAAGTARHNQVAARLDGKHRPDYVLIDISDARTFGIEPIEVEDAH
jgi:hypothetical protein